MTIKTIGSVAVGVMVLDATANMLNYASKKMPKKRKSKKKRREY